MKKSTKIILGILGSSLVLVIIICVVLFSVLGNQKNADYYNFGDDQITSVKAAIGVRDISGVSTSTQNGVSTKTYNYKSSTSANDVRQYIDYLTTKEGFTPTILNQQNDQPVYAKKSVDEGKILIITIIDTGFEYTIAIQKGEGTLSLSE